MMTRLTHPEVRYEVTDHCNARCVMCPREKHDAGRQHGIMDLDAYTKSLAEVVGLGATQIVLTGFGEPLIDRTLEEKIKRAKWHGCRTYLITNVSLLTAKRATSLIDAGLDEMRVSFYGMRPETYNAIMVNLDYDVAVENLERFLEIRGDRLLPKLHLSWLVFPENADQVAEFRRVWEPRADAIDVWKPHNWSDARDYRTRHQSVEMKTSCGRPDNGPLQIQWNGEVIPCCYDYNNTMVLGNAFTQPVLDIMNGEPYAKLREAHRSKDWSEFPFCNQCDQLLPHADALVYTNRHTLTAEEAVTRSNTDLYDLVGNAPIHPTSLNPSYREGLHVV